MTRRHSFLLATSLLVILWTAWVVIRPFGQPYLPWRPVYGAPGGSLRVEIADEPAEWEAGYSRRLTIRRQFGMLFLFPEAAPRSFWMKGMRFPLDIVFLRDNSVVQVFERVAPPAWRQTPVTVSVPEPGADAVLELPAGEAKRRGIAPGTAIPGLPRFR